MKTISFIILLLCCLIASPLALAQEQDEPILVIDPQGHSAMIKEVIFTPDGKSLISVSDDKTIRLWDTATGELLNTLRGQIGNGHEGKLFAAALSPDGMTLAVSGYAYGAGSMGTPILLFDIQSGEQIGLLKGHSNVIHALAFSRDGRLASGSKDDTVRIWDVAARKELAKLTGHTDAVYGVAFSPDGDRLVSVADDDIGILWDLGSKKVIKKLEKHTGDVNAVAFAPNGQYIVSGGFDDKILLWDGQGNFIKEIDSYSGNVATVSFSADSKKIVICGEGNYNAVVYAIPTGKKLTSFIRHNNSVAASAFFGTDRIATAGGDDKDIYIWDAASGDVKTHILSQGRTVGVNAFGGSLELSFGYGDPEEKYRPLKQSFDFSTMSLHPQTPTAGEFRRTRTEHRGMSLEKKGKYELKVVGDGTIEADRNRYDEIRSYTFTPKGNIAVGSNFSLKLYRPNGNFLREFTGHTGVVWAVSVDQSGRILASASDDQTVKLWNLQTGNLLASLFVARDKEWICWTPQGYYTASAGGEKYMGWQINQGMDKAAEYYPAYVFRKRFHNPELVRRTIEWASFDKALAEQNRQPGKRVIPEKITEILPPQVRWLVPERSPSSSKKNTVLIRAEVSSSVKITGLKIQVNGATAATFSEIKQQAGKGKFDRIIEYRVQLRPQENRIQVYAENSHASITSKVRTVRYDSLEWQKPRLYMVSIGIKEYQKDKNLAYAVVDAQAMARLFRTQKGRLFKEVHLKTLYNNEATEGRIIEALEWLEKNVTQNDIAVVFVAAHGYKHRENYYILPVEGDPKNLRRTAVDWRDYKDILGNLSTNKVLLYLDTCYSGQLAENFLGRGTDTEIDNTEAIRELTSEEYGVVIMAASTGNELSLEHPDWGHGAFTKALIEGFEQEKAERNGDSIINLQELDIYVTERVKELTDGKQHAKTNYSPGISISRFPIFQLR